MLKVAIVYDRVNKWGGAERVLLALHGIFPNAPLYTSVYDPKGAPWARVFPEIKTSFLQKIPLAKNNHELFAVLMPVAFASFDFSEFDLVISVTSEAAKGIKTKQGTLHICYCLTPTRYLWSHYNEYFKGAYFKIIAKPVVNYLRRLDRKASKNPDVMIAISSEVSDRIRKYYERDSVIIFPPVNTSLQYSNEVKKENFEEYYLLVNRLVGYKRVDLAIKAFNKLGLPLIIVGTGRLEKKLKSMVKSKKIKFVGRVTEKELANYYSKAKALIMSQEEDFGIVAVEAQSFGVPVIAYKKGGSLDTVISGKTGIFFSKQTSKSLVQAIRQFEKKHFNPADLINNSKRFSKKVFTKSLLELVKTSDNIKKQ